MGASPSGCKVGVAEVTDAASYDPTDWVELVLCHEAPNPIKSAERQSELLLDTIEECTRKRLTNKLSLQLRPQTVHANPACAGIYVKGLRRDKFAQ